MGAPIHFCSEDCRLQSRFQKNPKPNRKNRTSKAINPDSSSFVSVVKHPGVNLVMGQVKILKRGEKLSPDNNSMKKKKKKNDEVIDLSLASTKRIGPDPETMQKQVRVSGLTNHIYAGPTSMASPPPSSVPVPRFLGPLPLILDYF